jgi:hypothetical protein
MVLLFQQTLVMKVFSDECCVLIHSFVFGRSVAIKLSIMLVDTSKRKKKIKARRPITTHAFQHCGWYVGNNHRACASRWSN